MDPTDPVTPLPKVSAKKYPNVRGVGDVVAVAARPVAAIIDRLAGTSLKTCEGCARRREALNQKFPL